MRARRLAILSPLVRGGGIASARPGRPGRHRCGSAPSWTGLRPRGRRPRRGLADRLFLDERAGGPAAVEIVRGRDRRESELRAFLRFDHPVTHRDREPCPAAQLGSRRHHHREPAAQRRAAAVRSAGGARPDPQQARDPNRRWYGVYANYNTPAYNTNLVQESRPAEKLRGVSRPQGMGRQDRAGRHR